MITLNAQPPQPPASNSDLTFVTSLLAVLSDPAESKKQLTAMLEGRRAWTAARDEAIAEKKASDAAVSENRATIAQEQAAHSAQLRDAQAAFDQKCSAAWAEIHSTQTETKQLNNQARVDATAAAKLKTDLEARIAVIRQAGI